MKQLDIREEDFNLKKEYDFSKGIRGRFYRPKKVPTTIRLDDDDDILLFLKKACYRKEIWIPDTHE